MLTTEQWIQQRLDNCHTLAAEKTGKDRLGWQQDAAYFAAVLEALSALKAISNGEGYYGAQAREYKEIARAALAKMERPK